MSELQDKKGDKKMITKVQMMSCKQLIAGESYCPKCRSKSVAGVLLHGGVPGMCGKTSFRWECFSCLSTQVINTFRDPGGMAIRREEIGRIV